MTEVCGRRILHDGVAIREPRKLHDDGYGRCPLCGGSTKYALAIDPLLCSGCGLGRPLAPSRPSFRSLPKGPPIMALGLSDEEAAKLYRGES